MRLCIYEDSGAAWLEPITLTRPAFALWCGAERLFERQRRQFAEPSQHDERCGDRHELGDRHQIEAVHEIDQVHEPEARDQFDGAFDGERQVRRDCKIVGRAVNDCADGRGLQQEARQHRDRLDVIHHPHDRNRESGAEHL